jgi:hypothetical protein
VFGMKFIAMSGGRTQTQIVLIGTAATLIIMKIRQVGHLSKHKMKHCERVGKYQLNEPFVRAAPNPHASGPLVP